jgi:hypothetical protein
MAVRKKPSIGPPLPVGIVASGLSGVAPVPVTAPAPDDAVAATKSNKNWKQGRQGRVKLARAMKFKSSKNEENMPLIGNFPFGPFADMVAKEFSPLHELRQGPQWQVCRMAMFLIQMVLNLTKSYTPSAKLEHRFGSGHQTAPRIALLLHHEETIEGTWKTQLCRKKNFYARALKEGETLKAIVGNDVTSDPDNQWRVELLEDTREKLRQSIQDNAERHVATGMVSKVDNTKAYENMMSNQSWEAGLIYAVHLECIYHWDRVCTAAGIHPRSSGLVVGSRGWAGIECVF